MFLSQSALSFGKIRLSEDFYVDSLLEPVCDFGSVLLVACFPRSFVDVNRSPTELDPKLISNLDKPSINARTCAGLGVIPRVVGNGLEIYGTKISFSEVVSRLNNYYFPYHQKLKQLIDNTIDSFGFATLFDFHSMPHGCINQFSGKKSLTPEVVLGDCFGTSCDSRLSEKVLDIFSLAGFRVAMNNPFSGGFITKNYGMPKRNVQAIQVEIDRSIYMNENDFTLHSGYLELRKKLYHVTYELSRLKEYNDDLFQAAE
jgi:N-formylglutamate deformylase